MKTSVSILERRWTHVCTWVRMDRNIYSNNTNITGKLRDHNSKAKLWFTVVIPNPEVKLRYSSGNTKTEGIPRNPLGIPRNIWQYEFYHSPMTVLSGQN